MRRLFKLKHVSRPRRLAVVLQQFQSAGDQLPRGAEVQELALGQDLRGQRHVRQDGICPSELLRRPIRTAGHATGAMVFGRGLAAQGTADLAIEIETFVEHQVFHSSGEPWPGLVRLHLEGAEHGDCGRGVETHYADVEDRLTVDIDCPVALLIGQRRLLQE